jgi:predicted enzyme related to lactoylglutathione lyase
VITAVHALVYSDDPSATRAFFKDVLRWPFVSDAQASENGRDDPSNWLVFRSGRSELGVHPTSGQGYSMPRHHEISLMCDDLETTLAELQERGAEFEGAPKDQGFGIAVQVKVPGADAILLYQPKHRVAYGL